MSGTRVLCSDGKRKHCADGKFKKACAGGTTTCRIDLQLEDQQSSGSPRDLYLSLIGDLCYQVVEGTLRLYARRDTVVILGWTYNIGLCGHYLSPWIDGVAGNWDSGAAELAWVSGEGESDRITLAGGQRLQIYLRNAGGCVDGPHDDHPGRSLWSITGCPQCGPATWCQPCGVDLPDALTLSLSLLNPRACYPAQATSARWTGTADGTWTLTRQAADPSLCLWQWQGSSPLTGHRFSDSVCGNEIASAVPTLTLSAQLQVVGGSRRLSLSGSWPTLYGVSQMFWPTMIASLADCPGIHSGNLAYGANAATWGGQYTLSL